MKLTPALLLAFAAIATAHHTWSHSPYYTDECSNESESALPTVGPTGTGFVTPSPSPSETATSAPVSESESAASLTPTTSPTEPSPVSSTTVASAPTSSSTSTSGSGTTYKASFTEYGAGDTFGSANCNTATAACGWYSNPGYNAAASQNLFGTGPGGGAGPACGTCWKLTPETTSTGAAITGASSIIIKVNNLCPASGNPLCSQSGLTGTNQYGANVNFDLCIDDGASGALFGSSGTGLALGTAESVDCSQWDGSANLTS
ncbi:mucin 5B, oligomeric mucus gel-forming [Mycoblastus sanguinarius]|nr:mucin 5B, oligomeric mucus gel-forming [Mycoblastus sanguinarius]